MIRVGIIGYGKMGTIRHNALKSRSDVSVDAIYEENSTIEVPGGKRVSSPSDVLDNTDIDAVFVCTPNVFNMPYTKRSLMNSKHVFCEKPPAFTPAEVADIIDVETSSGKKLMYGFNHRHHESIRKIRELIDHNTFGKVLWMRGRYGKSVDEAFYSSWRAKKTMSGGGIFLDQGIHMLDLFMHLSGDFDVVKSIVSNVYWDLEIEDNVFAIFENSKTKVSASLHSTMTQWRHLFSLEIFLEKGYITLNGLKTPSGAYGAEELSIAENRTTAPAAKLTKKEVITYNIDSSWQSEIDHFIDAIQHKRDITVGTSRDALTLMTLVEKVYNNGKTNDK
tara:strand:+ start:1677 stop:2678 length:1002 start_codon:yes stop_codon:yes gene_type:complete